MYDASGNIILTADDSIWKNKTDKTKDLMRDDSKAKEDEFEDYLEDLLF
jgi:hypothetical protein